MFDVQNGWFYCLKTWEEVELTVYLPGGTGNGEHFSKTASL